MNPGTLIATVLVTLIGLAGLYVAAHAIDGGLHLFGLVMAAFAVLFTFWMIKQHFDALERR
jgi:hypothetical protein